MGSNTRAGSTPAAGTIHSRREICGYFRIDKKKECRTVQDFIFENEEKMKIRMLSEYCKEKFGTKVYRLSLSTGCTCPNRDGKAGFGGCTFCSEEGSGEFTARQININQQIEFAKRLVDRKFPKNMKEDEKKYIAYFQSFTNTYGDIEKLRKIFFEAANRDDIIALAIATRPDCLDDEMVEMLREVNKKKPIWVELGLQTINEDCAVKFNRGYGLDCFYKTYNKLKNENFEVIVHVILGLPYEEKIGGLKTVEYLSKLNPPLDGIKLHLLHIIRGTKLAREYEENPFPILSLEEYADLVVLCLKTLPETTVIHRLTGDGDKKKLIAPLWSKDKKKVLNYLNKKINEAKR